MVDKVTYIEVYSVSNKGQSLSSEKSPNFTPNYKPASQSDITLRTSDITESSVKVEWSPFA